MGWFHKRKRVLSSSAPQLYAYAQGYQPTPGALGFALEKPFNNPVVLVRGPGMIYKSMRTLQPPQVIQTLALPYNPYQGSPFGSIAQQALLSQVPTTE